MECTSEYVVELDSDAFAHTRACVCPSCSLYRIAICVHQQRVSLHIALEDVCHTQELLYLPHTACLVSVLAKEVRGLGASGRGYTIGQHHTPP